MIKIYRTIATNKLTQDFHDSKACISRQGKVISKRGNVCPIGYQDLYKSFNMNSHGAKDFACFYREPTFFPIVATDREGKTVNWYSKEASDVSGGLGVDIFSVEPIALDVLPDEAGPQARELWLAQNHSIRLKMRIWHLDQAWKDRDVKLGEMVGLGGSTGNSSGNHNHNGIKLVGKNDETLDRNNGWYGNVDYSMWYTNQFILDKLGKKNRLTNAQLVYKVAYYFRMPIFNEVGKLLEVK